MSEQIVQYDGCKYSCYSKDVKTRSGKDSFRVFCRRVDPKCVAQGFTASPKILPRLDEYNAQTKGAPFALSPLPSEAPTFPPEGTQTPPKTLSSAT